MPGETRGFAVQASDTVDDPNGPFTTLVVGGAGALPIVTLGGDSVTITATAGQVIPLPVRRVKSTGLAATGVIGFRF